MRSFILINCMLGMLFFASNVAHADASVKCMPVAVKSQDKNILLPGVDQKHATQIYFLKNISKHSLWLDHPVERHTKATWSTYFQPEKWSAILVNRKDFAISCSVIQPGDVSKQDCAKVVSVCAPKTIVYESKRKGSYWLSEDKDWEDLLSVLKQKGVKLH